MFSLRKISRWVAGAAVIALSWTAWPAAAQGTGPLQPPIMEAYPALDTAVPDRAAFALRLTKPLDAKARPQALCDVQGIRSGIPIEVIASPRREAVLEAYGVPEAQFKDAQQPWIVVRCQTTLPDGAHMALHWLRVNRAELDGLKAPIGNIYWDGQHLPYLVRSDWPFSVVCNRSNASSGCNPFEPVRLLFTQAVSKADLTQVRLRAQDGTVVAPLAVRNEGDDYASELSFAKLKPEQSYAIEWPLRLAGRGGADILGQARGKAAPKVLMGPYPPLLKFSAAFGIAERAIGGVVPLSVRHIEGKETSTLPPGRLHVLKIKDEAGIIEAHQTLMRVRANDDAGPRGGATDEESDEPTAPAVQPAAGVLRYPFAPFAKVSTNRNGSVGDTRGTSWLKSVKGTQSQELPRQLDMTEFEVIGIPLKEPGFYLLEAESLNLGRSLLARNRPMFVRSGALVTDLGVHWHVSERTAAIWVTSLSTGQGVASAAVTIYDCNAKRIAAGQTNAQGWVQIDAKLQMEWGCPKFVFARKDDDLGMLRSDWQKGIETWRFERLYEYGGPGSGATLSHAVLARNLLRGGEMLHARLYARSINTRGLLEAPAPAELPKTINLVHTGSGDRKNVSVTWDARGNADLSYKIPDGIKRGAYTLEAGRWAFGGGQFRVEDFRLPVLKAEVLSPMQPVVFDSGKNAKVDISMRLSYLSGGPAAGETVQISQRLLPHTPRFAGYEEFWFGRNERYRGEEDDAVLEQEDSGSAVGEDKARKLDAQGSLVLTTRLNKGLDRSRVLLTEMEYRDPNGETYRAQGRSVISPANVVLGVKADYWASGKERKVDFVALTPMGKPAAGAHVEVQGGFADGVWHRRKTVGGYYGYHYESVEYKPVALCAGRTDAQGRFTCRYTPAMEAIDGGQFRVQASAADDQGRKSQVQTTVWLYGGEEVFFDQGEHDRMDVLVERTRYKPGETAVLQVRSPFREATAWVNILRSGAVVDTLVLPLSGQKPTLQIPIKASYGPNVFVNVLAVRGRVGEPQATALVDLARPAFKLGIVQLEVGTEANQLRVKVSTNKSTYQSRETATAVIEVSAAPGQSLPADREATVFAIDEALLELLPNDTWDVLKTMMAPRGYGFESASASMQVIGKRHFGRKAVPAGGGGGKSAAREMFDTLLLWRGSVPLDAQGRAQVQIPVNDSLTRFRVVAVVNAGPDRFGFGHSSFVATKDLQLLSGLPATVREGDRLRAGFTLRNTTQQSMHVSVAAQVGSTTLAPLQVAVGAGEAKPISWVVDVPANIAQLRWQLQATSQASSAGPARSDALIVTQQVGTHLNALRFTVGASRVPSLDVDKEPWVAVVQAPAGSIAGRGELRVSLAPALAADASGVRDYMRSYPFYCLEQRTSKAVSLKDTTLWGIISGGIDQYITESGLVNYYPSQYGSDQGYDTLTAFVLSASHEAGWSLPPDATKRMLDGLERFVQGKLVRRYGYYQEDAYELTERKLLALEALSRYRPVSQTLTESLRLDPVQDLPKLSHRGLVQWMDVLQRSTWSNKAQLQAIALADLEKRFVTGADGSVRLKESGADNRWYWMYSESTSLVRAALLALDVPALEAKADGLARGAVASQRGASHWWETQSNVWGSLMLDKRARKASGTLAGVTTVAVGTQTFQHDWARLPEGESYRFPLSALTGQPAGVGAVAVLHKGQGSPYAVVAGTAFGEPSRVHENDAQITRSMRAVRVKTPGQVSAGDIWEVQLRFSARSGMGWLVVSDPVPAGATILGSGLRGQEAAVTPSREGRRNSDGSWEAWPAYVERSFTHVRAYYEYLWGSSNTFTYQVRINNAGQFKMPATQLEAMYDPSVYSYRPNPVLDVK